MAGGREHTDEDRYELVGEARELARGAVAGTTPPFKSTGASGDALVASMVSRASVDNITPVGRMRGMKRSMLKMSQVFLRDQAAFNRLTVTALEDLTARLDAAEARLASLETNERGAGPDA